MATLEGLFSDIASAIKSKLGTSTKIVATDFPSKIRSIPTGGIPYCSVYVGNDPSHVTLEDWDDGYLLFNIETLRENEMLAGAVLIGSFSISNNMTNLPLFFDSIEKAVYSFDDNVSVKIGTYKYRDIYMECNISAHIRAAQDTTALFFIVGNET